MSHGARNVTHGTRKVSNGVSKVSCGARKVSKGARKVLYGTRKFSDSVRNKAQRDSIRSQTIHSKGTAYDITNYQTFLTKYEIECPFKRTFVNSRGTAYHIL